MNLILPVAILPQEGEQRFFLGELAQKPSFQPFTPDAKQVSSAVRIELFQKQPQGPMENEPGGQHTRRQDSSADDPAHAVILPSWRPLS